MPTLVADADVKQILATTMQTQPFIETAHLLVTLYLGSAGYSLAHLTEIERWWAAHLCCVQEPRIVSKTLSDTRIEYQRPVSALGLAGTPYGQQVLLLDTEGYLATEIASLQAALKPATFDVD